MSNISPILIEALITYCDYFFPEGNNIISLFCLLTSAKLCVLTSA